MSNCDFQCSAPNPDASARISLGAKDMPKQKLHVVRDEGRVPEPVTTISRDEEVRLLGLADTALHNEHPPDPKLKAGDHAREEHQRLKHELQETVESVEKKKNRAA
jgi:hypothetical protein